LNIAVILIDLAGGFTVIMTYCKNIRSQGKCPLKSQVKGKTATGIVLLWYAIINDQFICNVF